MNADFRVSVITPVYNTAARVKRAVESALSLPQVGEVILVEDGSADNSLEVCRELAASDSRVVLIQHPNGENRGAGASRNFGVAQAKFPFIAFLDADDWYLPHRFEKDAELLRDGNIDGVYNALGNHYESEELRAQWYAQDRPEVMTLSAPVPPEELILVLFWCHPEVSGEFQTNTITVRRAFFDRVGGFLPALRLQQDTHLWKRMAAAGRLAAGNIQQPVSIRCVHTENRMTRVKDHDQYRELWWTDLGESLHRLGASPAALQAWRRGFSRYLSGGSGSKVRSLRALLSWVIREPRELFRGYGHFDTSLRQIFGDHKLLLRLLSMKNRLQRM